MKLFIKLSVLLIVFYVVWNYAKNSSQEESLVSFSNKDGNFSVTIREKEKEKIRAAVKKIKDLVYYEATVHNPPGDMLPDQIDNKIIQEVKEKVN